MKKLICFFSILFFISCGNSQEIKNISTVELKSLLSKSEIQLLDVRTDNEIKEGFIKTALFVDFYKDDFFTDAAKQLDKNKPVYIYCRSGHRSGKASKILQDKGYKVFNIEGGFSKWKTENK